MPYIWIAGNIYFGMSDTVGYFILWQLFWLWVVWSWHVAKHSAAYKRYYIRKFANRVNDYVEMEIRMLKLKDGWRI